MQLFVTCYKIHQLKLLCRNTINMRWRVQTVKLMGVWFSPVICFFLSVRFKYLIQHSVLKSSTLVLFSQIESSCAFCCQTHGCHFCSVTFAFIVPVPLPFYLLIINIYKRATWHDKYFRTESVSSSSLLSSSLPYFLWKQLIIATNCYVKML